MKRVEIFKHKINLQDLPPKVLLIIFSHLTIPTLQQVCMVSKKFKIFCYQDDVYLLKLKKLGLERLLYIDCDLNDDFLMLLKQIPDITKSIPTEKRDTKILVDIPESDQIDLIIQKDTAAASPDVELTRKERNTISIRALFKKFYCKFVVLYKDFEQKSLKSILFTTYKDICDVAIILGHLQRFDTLQMLNKNCSKIHSNLLQSVESFASNLISRFETAYDQQNYPEMEVVCKACYYIDGASDLVNLVISKNPAFYDLQYNSSNLQLALKSNKTKEMDKFLAQHFADFMQYILDGCLLQCEIIAKVFPIKVDPLSIIVLKILEESVVEYFAAVVSAAKIREGTRVYLHVTSSCIYCIKQFIHQITNNSFGVILKTDQINQKASNLLVPFLNTYLDRELEYLKELCQSEIEKWDNQKQSNKPMSPVYMNDPENQLAHRNQVMSAMKKIMQAPAALTSTLLGNTKIKYEEPMLTDGAFDLDIESNSSSDGQVLVTSAKVDEKTDSINSLVSIELAITLIQANKTSLSRATIVSSFINYTKM